jgi:hypothetical protein
MGECLQESKESFKGNCFSGVYQRRLASISGLNTTIVL